MPFQCSDCSNSRSTMYYSTTFGKVIKPILCTEGLIYTYLSVIPKISDDRLLKFLNDASYSPNYPKRGEFMILRSLLLNQSIYTDSEITSSEFEFILDLLQSKLFNQSEDREISLNELELIKEVILYLCNAGLEPCSNDELSNLQITTELYYGTRLASTMKEDSFGNAISQSYLVFSPNYYCSNYKSTFKDALSSNCATNEKQKKS